jgi:hypothetical protein
MHVCIYKYLYMHIHKSTCIIMYNNINIHNNKQIHKSLFIYTSIYLFIYTLSALSKPRRWLRTMVHDNLWQAIFLDLFHLCIGRNCNTKSEKQIFINIYIHIYIYIYIYQYWGDYMNIRLKYIILTYLNNDMCIYM